MELNNIIIRDATIRDKDETCKDCSYKINDDCICHVDLYKLNR